MTAKPPFGRQRLNASSVRWCRFALVVSIWLVGSHGADSIAADRASEFLARLRERGWNDVALEYLENAADDPLASPEFLRSVPYEAAVCRSALARQSRSHTERAELLQQAASDFREFIGANPNSPLLYSAYGKLANLLADQALSLLSRAERLPPEAANGQGQLHVEARALLGQAATALDTLVPLIQQKLSTMPKGTAGASDDALLAQRRDLEEQLAEASFLSATVQFEASRTFEVNTAERQEALQAAITSFRQLQKEYENKLVGYYARLYEGRCNQILGRNEQALEIFGEIVNTPVGHEVFRKLITEALRYRAECLLETHQIDRAIDECGEWLDRSSKDERDQGPWVALTYRLAECYAAKAQLSPDNPQASRWRSEARKLFREVSQQSGEFQDQARAALALSGTDSGPPQDVKGFADAVAAGKAALEHMNATSLAAKLAKNNNPPAVEELQRQANEHRAAALQYLETALRAANDRTSAGDLAEVHYFLCWLYWEDGRSREAAEAGLHVAQDYPESPFAPMAAKVALVAYEQLYLTAQNAHDASQAESDGAQLRSLAKLIVGRWPDSESANAATSVLVSLALNGNQFDEADEFLARLTKEARGKLGLNLGRTLWSRYLQSSATKGNSAIAGKLKSRAKALLAAGYKHAQDKADLTLAEAEGVLSYAQLRLAEGAASEGLAVLENPAAGPLAQAKRLAANPAGRPFAVETYKAALQAYLTVEPPRGEQAIAMMEQLESLVGSAGDNRAQLVGVYVSLGRHLQQQIEMLQSQGNEQQANALSATFSELLERIVQQSESQSWRVRAWLAETYLNLGENRDGKDARRLLEQAEALYRDILSEADQNLQSGPTKKDARAIRKKLGECLEAQGEYKAAIQNYTEILAKQPNLLELQSLTATAYQNWGIANRDPTLLEKSIFGAEPQPSGKNLVWGWIQMARVLDSARAHTKPEAMRAKYDDLYFSARYQAAVARLTAAKLGDVASRADQLRTVRQSIATLRQLYPDLGGPAWQAKFEQLLQETQELQRQ